MPTSSADTRPALHRSDRVAMAALGASILAGGVVWFAGSLYALVRRVMGGTLSLELTVLDPRVDSDLPAGLNTIAWDGAQANVDLVALGPVIATLLLGSQSLMVIVGAIVTGAIGIVLLRLARRAPFHRSLFAVAVVAGATLSLGSVIALGSHIYGSLKASDRVNELIGSQTFAVDATADPLPVLLGLVVMAMAVVFRSGERLQRDTEGLI